MKKNVILCILSCMLLLSACTKENDSTTNDNITDIKETNSYLAKDYLGEAGYIVHNQIFDYSDYFETVYEWVDGIKMPFEKPENSEVVWIGEEDGVPSIQLTEMDENAVNKCVETLKNIGFYVNSLEEGTANKYKLFKDNFRITLCYFSDDNICNIECYMGNVVGERTVSVEDARELLKKENLVNVDEYHIFAIESESIGNAGYYEFIVENNHPLEKLVYWYNESYYMITDGEKIMLFEQNLLGYECPTNANIVVDNDNVELVISGEPERTDVCANKITSYKLENGVFEKKWSYSTWNVSYGIQGVVTKIENNEIVYYLMQYSEDFEKNRGGKDIWHIKEKYSIDEKYIDFLIDK